MMLRPEKVVFKLGHSLCALFTYVKPLVQPRGAVRVHYRVLTATNVAVKPSSPSDPLLA
jgi:hypothetical protein